MVGIATLALLVDDSFGLLVGLSTLRDCGDVTAPAVESILALKQIQRLRTGWELAEILLEVEGESPDAALLTRFDQMTLDLTRRALWG